MKEPDFLCPQINTINNKLIERLGKTITKKFLKELEQDLLNIKISAAELRVWGKSNISLP